MERYISIQRWIALIVLGVIAPALGQTTTQTVTDEQKAKLDSIDKYIECQRQEINNDYAMKLIEIRTHRENQLRRLEIINPELYVRCGFVGWAGYVQNSLALRGIDLMDDSQFVGTFRDLHNEGNGLSAVEKMELTPRLLAIAEDRFAAEQNRTLRGYEAAELQAAKNRDYALNVQLPQFSEQLKNNCLNPPTAKPAGFVSGIVYSGDKSAAIVGSQIIHSGDTLGSVRIVKINLDTVEFDKNGHSWTQKIGEAPSTMWQ
jgi:hypothetical protein